MSRNSRHEYLRRSDYLRNGLRAILSQNGVHSNLTRLKNGTAAIKAIAQLRLFDIF